MKASIKFALWKSHLILQYLIYNKNGNSSYRRTNRMYMIYVDESGDPGKLSSFGSKHYILSGLINSANDRSES